MNKHLLQHIITRLACCAFLLALCNKTTAQLALMDDRKINYAGKDFWFTLRSPLGDGAIVISAATDANITFEYLRNPSLNKNYFVKGGELLREQLTTAEIQAIAGGPFIQASAVVNNGSIHVYSDTDITVQFLYMGGANDDGVLILPSDKQNYGDDFYFNGATVYSPTLYNAYTGTPNHGAFSIVSRCDSVVLEITPSVQTLTRPPGVPYTVVMKRGNSYVINPNGNQNDLSGTTVQVKYASCCNPINVFIDNDATYMRFPVIPLYPQPNSAGYVRLGCCADRLMDQVLPVNVWDTVYPVACFANNQYNVIKIVSASNNNRIFFDGSYVCTLNDKGKYDTMIEKGVVITSTSPISVTQHMVSETETQRAAFAAANGGGVPPNPDSLSDPASLWIIPIRDGLRETYFKAYGYNIAFPNGAVYRLNYATLICKTSSVNTIQLNNVNIASRFVPFPNNPAYMYAYIKMDTVQTYHLQSKDRILAYYYGAYSQGSTVFNIGDLNVSPFVTAPVRSFKPDSFAICYNDKATLSVGQADKYQWSNGDSVQSIQVTDTGLYYVHMRYDDSCGRGGTKIFHVRYKDYTEDNAKDTLYKCLREEIILTANDADKYLWSSGDSTKSIHITAMGDAYHVVETYQPICHKIDRAFAVLPTPQEPLKPIELGNDTLICRRQPLTLKGSGPTTQWSDGSVGNEMKVYAAGTYWAKVEETCYETHYEDTIVVTDTLCLTAADTLNSKDYCGLFFPNAFTPNADGKNDLFRGIYYGEFTVFNSYQLSIYNRWGAKVYETADIKSGWDGMYNGFPSDIGVYYYICRYSCPLKENLFLKGEITLIR